MGNPTSHLPTGCAGICLYVSHADVVSDRAGAAGAQALRPVADQFYGDRSGSFLDPFGHQWTVATRKENLTVEEIHHRPAAMMQSDAAPTPFRRIKP